MQQEAATSDMAVTIWSLVVLVAALLLFLLIVWKGPRWGK
jgi:hypothetical protein